MRFTASLNVRSGPDSTYDVIGSVHGGELYISVGDSDGYHEIWYNRSRGWIHDDHVELASTAYDDVFKGTNVRTGPFFGATRSSRKPVSRRVRPSSRQRRQR